MPLGGMCGVKFPQSSGKSLLRESPQVLSLHKEFIFSRVGRREVAYNATNATQGRQSADRARIGQPSRYIPAYLVYVFICKLFYPLQEDYPVLWQFLAEVEYKTTQNKATQDKILNGSG